MNADFMLEPTQKTRSPGTGRNFGRKLATCVVSWTTLSSLKINSSNIDADHVVATRLK